MDKRDMLLIFARTEGRGFVAVPHRCVTFKEANAKGRELEHDGAFYMRCDVARNFDNTLPRVTAP